MNMNMNMKLLLALSLLLPFTSVACDDAAMLQTMQRFSAQPQATAVEKAEGGGGEEEGCEEAGAEEDGVDDGGEYCCITNVVTDTCVAWCGG